MTMMKKKVFESEKFSEFEIELQHHPILHFALEFKVLLKRMEASNPYA